MLWMLAPSKASQASLWYPVRDYHLRRMPAATIVHVSHNFYYHGPQFERFYHSDIYIFCFCALRPSREWLLYPNLHNFYPGMLGDYSYAVTTGS